MMLVLTLAPSCNPNPAGFVDGLVVGIGGLVALLLLTALRGKY